MGLLFTPKKLHFKFLQFLQITSIDAQQQANTEDLAVGVNKIYINYNGMKTKNRKCKKNGTNESVFIKGEGSRGVEGIAWERREEDPRSNMRNCEANSKLKPTPTKG